MTSGPGCNLSDLIKRRLESVASTGSSASSGFIEDKSYCDSEEDEEGSVRTSSFPPHLPPQHSMIPPLFSSQNPMERFLAKRGLKSQEPSSTDHAECVCLVLADQQYCQTHVFLWVSKLFTQVGGRRTSQGLHYKAP